MAEDVRGGVFPGNVGDQQDYEVAFVAPEVVRIADHNRRRREEQILEWQRAAEEGSTDAQLELGLNYLFGSKGLPQDDAKAFEYLTSMEEQDAEAK